MENITVGQILAIIAAFAALITGGVKIKDAVKKWLTGMLSEKFAEQKKETDAIKTSVEDLKKQLNTVDLENCKNYLVTYLSAIERGEEKDEIEHQRFYEEYQHYVEHGGNSYIKDKVSKLRNKGLI